MGEFINVFMHWSVAYGDKTSPTVLRSVMRKVGDWYVIDKPVETSNGKSCVIHKSRILFLPGEQ